MAKGVFRRRLLPPPAPLRRTALGHYVWNCRKIVVLAHAMGVCAMNANHVWTLTKMFADPVHIKAYAHGRGCCWWWFCGFLRSSRQRNRIPRRPPSVRRLATARWSGRAAAADVVDGRWIIDRETFTRHTQLDITARGPVGRPTQNWL